MPWVEREPPRPALPWAVIDGEGRVMARCATRWAALAILHTSAVAGCNSW